eukprot:g23753.t1
MLKLFEIPGKVISVDLALEQAYWLTKTRAEAAAKRLKVSKFIDWNYVVGGSKNKEVREKVERLCSEAPCMVVSDSDHDFEHTYYEMEWYAQHVGIGQYLIVEDTNIYGWTGWMNINDPNEADLKKGPMEAANDFEFKHRADFIRTDWCAKHYGGLSQTQNGWFFRKAKRARDLRGSRWWGDRLDSKEMLLEYMTRDLMFVRTLAALKLQRYIRHVPAKALKSCLSGAAQTERALVVGDSWASYSLQSLQESCDSITEVENRGIAGTTAAQWAARHNCETDSSSQCCQSSKSCSLFDVTFEPGFTYAWVSIGGNDFFEMACSMDVNRLTSVQQSIEQRAAQAWGATFVDVSESMGGNTTHWSQTDFFRDSIHLNAAGYTQLWSTPALQEAFQCAVVHWCCGVGRPDQECLTVKDFTQEELLAVLEPLLARMPAESARHYYWSSILCSLVVTFTTWAFLLSCFRSCCRQKTGRKSLGSLKKGFRTVSAGKPAVSRDSCDGISKFTAAASEARAGQCASGEAPARQPETAVSAHDPSEVLDEELSEDWCQVYRHSEARRNAAALREEKRDKAEPTPPAAPVAVPVAAASVRSKAAPKETGHADVHARPAPPAVPPPPPPGELCTSSPRSPPPVDMGCLSGGTGGTPLAWEREEAPKVALCQAETKEPDTWRCDAPLDDVGKRLEAMVEELAGPSSFELLEDAFSKVDAARLMQELHMLLRQAEKIQAPAQDVQINLDAGYERHTSGATEPLDRSAKESGQKPEFHVVRIEGQTKVKRDSKDETKKRAYGSHFDKMDKRSASFNQDSTSKLFRIFGLMCPIICAIIVANTVVMAFEAQYYGLQVGYDLGMRTYDLPSAIAWPGADFVWELSEWLFGPIFLIELLLKLAGMKFTFFLDVIAWLIDTVFRGFWPIDPMLLRLAKLGRLLRLMRLVRKLKGFDALYILTTALRGSVTVLLWSFLMLFLLQLIFALFLQRIVQDTITFGDRSVQVNEELFLYFGTCTRCLLTMFEITLGNWPPVARLLQDHVHEAFCAFSIIHKITVGYALIAVINGVFLKETFSAAENDDKIRMRNTEKKRNQHIKKMQSLFEAFAADETGDGVLDRDEFIQVMSDPEIVNWLAAMDLQIADPNALFEMVQGDLAESEKSEGTINAEQLVMGVSRLKGAARSVS